MKITSLDLTGFRSFRNAHFKTDFSRLYFGGANGAGKTSIREAIKWALTGRCEVTDGRGAGAEELIAAGATETRVAVTIDGIGTVTRELTKSGQTFSVDGFTGNSMTQYGAFLGKLNTSQAYLDAVLDTEAFSRMHHSDAKGLILQLLNVRVPWEDQELTLDQIETRYQRAFEDRKLAKRTLQQFRRPDPPKVQEFPSREQIDEQMNKLKALIADQQKAIGGTIATRATLTEELERLDVMEPQKDPSLDKRIEELLAALQEEQAPPTPKSDAERSDAVKVVLYRKTIDALKAHNPQQGCIMDAAVRCKTAKANFASRIDFLQASVDRIVHIQGEPMGPTKTVSDLQQDLSTLRAQLARYEERHAAWERAVARKKEIEKKLKELPSTAEGEAAIATLQVRVGKGDDLIRAKTAYDLDVNRFNQGAAEQQKLEDEVKRLEALCEELGPTGVRVKALVSAAERFETAINRYLASWNYTVRFEVEPWRVMVNGRPFQTYSKSERWRIGMAIQLAIAQFSGLKFAILDEVDILDLDVRASFMDLILDNSPEIEQVFILATREKDKPLPSKWVQSYRIEYVDGESRLAVEPVEATA